MDTKQNPIIELEKGDWYVYMLQPEDTIAQVFQKKSRGTLAVSGPYMWNKDTVGVVVSKGQVLSCGMPSSPTRPAFGVIKPGEWHISKLAKSTDNLGGWGGLQEVIEGGPTLVWEDKDVSKNSYWEEGFDRGVMDSTKQVGIGEREDGMFFVVASFTHDGFALAKKFRDLGCGKAMKLAGGKNMFLKFEGKMLGKTLMRSQQYGIEFSPRYVMYNG